jgi:hypothetical protein
VSRGDDFSYESPTAPPGALFVEGDEPLLIFPSVSAAKRYIEAPDVADGIYRAAYGPNGEPYRVSSDGNRVMIERTDGPESPYALKLLLLRYLEACGDPADATQSLEELVSAAWSMERDFWLANDPHNHRFANRLPIWGCIGVVGAICIILYFSLR